MKEELLHYVWKYQKLNTLHLKTTQNNQVVIHHPGVYHELAGPDFFNAQIEIDGQKWAGNIEIHVKSSDWYLHNHERDPAYNNVILHVVWENDTAVFGPDNCEIPVVALQDYISADLLHNYRSLVTPKTWINCQNQLKSIPPFLLSNWQERLFFERLERKSQLIAECLILTQNDWEAVLFLCVAKNFGLNTNGDSFFALAKAIPFSVIRKEAIDLQNLEALLFGMAGLLEADNEDTYFKELQFRFYYLLQKHNIQKKPIAPLQFFKHRPDNFPTIRLAQLASVYHHRTNLFSKICDNFSLISLYALFTISPSSYWKNHYLFDKESPNKSKKTTHSLIDLLIINTILPLQFAYAKHQGKEITEDALLLIQGIAPEKNSILDKFKTSGVAVANAFESQSLLQLKSEYCSKNKCLDCAIGAELLKT
jgi:hypothetical protein